MARSWAGRARTSQLRTMPIVRRTLAAGRSTNQRHAASTGPRVDWAGDECIHCGRARQTKAEMQSAGSHNGHRVEHGPLISASLSSFYYHYMIGTRLGLSAAHGCLNSTAPGRLPLHPGAACLHRRASQEPMALLSSTWSGDSHSMLFTLLRSRLVYADSSSASRAAPSSSSRSSRMPSSRLR